MKFGTKLDKLRKERGVSVREIARQLRIPSQNTIAGWISGEGEPRLSQAIEAARYFGVPLSYLAYEEEPEPIGQLDSDERAILAFFRVLKRTRGLELEEAMALLEGARGIGAHHPVGLHPVAVRDETEMHRRIMTGKCDLEGKGKGRKG